MLISLLRSNQCGDYPGVPSCTRVANEADIKCSERFDDGYMECGVNGVLTLNGVNVSCQVTAKAAPDNGRGRF